MSFFAFSDRFTRAPEEYLGAVFFPSFENASSYKSENRAQKAVLLDFLKPPRRQSAQELQLFLDKGLSPHFSAIKPTATLNFQRFDGR